MAFKHVLDVRLRYSCLSIGHTHEPHRNSSRYVNVSHTTRQEWHF